MAALCAICPPPRILLLYRWRISVALEARTINADIIEAAGQGALVITAAKDQRVRADHIGKPATAARRLIENAIDIHGDIVVDCSGGTSSQKHTDMVLSVAGIVHGRGGIALTVLVPALSLIRPESLLLVRLD